MSENVKYYLGFDFGASSGRAMLGALTTQENGEKTLRLEEVYRFPNEPILKKGVYVWETERLFDEMRTSLIKIAQDPRGIRIESIGIDTWGVDFGIVGANGELIYSPVSYRDGRTNGMMEESFAVMSKEEIFRHTGLAFMQFNTLYQLLAMRKNPREAALIDEKNTLLFMPDLFAWYLTGEMGTEYTIASTSQLIDPATRGWSKAVLNAFGIPEGFFAPLQQPGSRRGLLRRDICPALDYDIPVVAVASHDTASAVAAVPAEKGKYFAYLSSGTWSLLGVESDTPVCTPEVMRANFTNEGGLNGTSRVLKNIMGLWIIQECRKQFNQNIIRFNRRHPGGEKPKCSFAGIVDGVLNANRDSLPSGVIDVDDGCFLAPGGMPARISAYYKKRYGAGVRGVAQLSYLVFKSLALKYRWGVDAIEGIFGGRHIDVLHIVGGGCNNRLLSQYTANAIGRPVVTGPSEGTVIGNLLVQAVASGEIEDLWALRRVVARSFDTETFLPEPDGAEKWASEYRELLEQMEKNGIC